jgi:hypothetical protein
MEVNLFLIEPCSRLHFCNSLKYSGWKGMHCIYCVVWTKLCILCSWTSGCKGLIFFLFEFLMGTVMEIRSCGMWGCVVWQNCTDLLLSYLFIYPGNKESPDSVVYLCSLVTRYGLDSLGIEWIMVGVKFPAAVQTGPWAHPASYMVGTGSLLGVKQLGCGVDH